MRGDAGGASGDRMINCSSSDWVSYTSIKQNQGQSPLSNGVSCLGESKRLQLTVNIDH